MRVPPRLVSGASKRGTKTAAAREQIAVAFAQFRLLDLAHDVLRDRFDEEQRLGRLVTGQFALGLGDDGVGVERHPRLGRRDRDDAFAEIRVRHADDRRFGDAGDAVEHAFDFLGIDVEAARYDQILRAADDVDVAARVDHADVAGLEESVGAKRFGGLLGLAPITREDVRPAHLDVADRAVGEHRAVVSADPDLDARQRQADRTGDTVAVERVGRVHVGLGHAVALEDGVTGTRFEGGEGLGGQRRRTRDEQPHVAAQPGVEIGRREQPAIECRHAHHHRRARQQADHLVGVEARQEDHARAVHQRHVERDEQPVRVEQR